jgi:glycerophosphoryl diester phosphodiesterase
MQNPGQTLQSDAPISFSELARSVWRDFWRARRPLVAFEILFKLSEAWLLIPALAVVFALILRQAGHVAVSNFDVVAFLLSPFGLLYATLVGTLATALFLFEQAGVMMLAARFDAGDRPALGSMIAAIIRPLPRIAKLGAIQAALVTTALLPFALLAGLTYWSLLSEFDIYFYWKERPPVFWIAAGIGSILSLLALGVATFLLVRWALAVPIVIFEGQSAGAALRASRDRVRGAGRRMGVALCVWLVGNLLVGVIAEAVFRVIAAALLANAGDRPTAVIVLLLIAKGALVATLSFVLVVGLGLLIRRIYVLRSKEPGRVVDAVQGAATEAVPSGPRWSWRLTFLTLPLFLLAPIALWASLSRYLTDRPLPKVTAHRGHARAAPENTLSAMRKAIESGADYAEMDVQLTSDGAIVLLHDRDLKRVAGDPRRLEDVTFAEVRRLDVGSWFDASFAGERVPTLAEVIELCRGKIRLNIELKFFTPDRKLVRPVAELIRDLKFEDDCLITSLNYDALREAQAIDPQLRVGLTVAHSIGDISRLDVNALSVRADVLTDGILRSAHGQGREVHVWTVNGAGQMGRLIMRGVDNIITSDPDLAIQVRGQWAKATGAERLVLAARLLLGLELNDVEPVPTDESGGD